MQEGRWVGGELGRKRGAKSPNCEWEMNPAIARSSSRSGKTSNYLPFRPYFTKTMGEAGGSLTPIQNIILRITKKNLGMDSKA